MARLIIVIGFTFLLGSSWACRSFCFGQKKEALLVSEQTSDKKIDSSKSVVSEKRISLNVSGMTCTSCEFHVRRVLKKVHGVKEAKVTAKDGKAEVLYDTSMTKPQDLVDAVNKAGYKAIVADSAHHGG